MSLRKNIKNSTQTSSENYDNKKESTIKKELNELNLHDEYDEVFEFLLMNKEIIILDNIILKEIVSKLDFLLINAESMSDLHRDMRIILETVRIQNDALLRGYRNNLSIIEIINKSNNNELNEFYKNLKDYSFKAKFADNLRLQKPNSKDKRTISRIRYDIEKGEALEPDTITLIDDNNESIIAITKIRQSLWTKVQ